MIGRHPCDEGVVLAAPASRPCAPASRPWILATTVLGSSLAFVDGSVVNVALPTLQRELQATVADVQWVVEAYALMLASLLLAGGALGDRLGRRRVYATGVALFAAASAACGLAAGVRGLVVARGVQGVGAALLVPGSLAIISASVPEGERGRAIGTWSSFGAVATALGPVAGGWLIEHASWRWAFFLNVPVAAVVIAMLFTWVPESRDRGASGPLDWEGAILVTLGLGGVVYGLVESSRLGWHDPRVWGALAGGGGALVAFGVVEARSRHPMVPLVLFRSTSFTGANVMTLFLYGALGALFFFLPLDLVQVHGYSSTAAGGALLPFIVVVSALSRAAGGLVDRVGSKLPLVVGPLVAAAGFALFAVPGTGGDYRTTFLPPALVLGVGMAISIAPLTTTVMNAVDVRSAGVASGINNAVSRTAGLLAVALLSLLVVRTFDGELDRRLDALRLTPDVAAAIAVERVKLAGAELPTDAPAAERLAVRRAVAEAFVTGFRRMMLVCVGLAIAGALSAASLIGGPVGAPAQIPAGRSPMTPVARSSAISSSERPSVSRSTSSLC